MQNNAQEKIYIHRLVMTSQQNRWTREELILTLSVYFQLPFGRLNRVNFSFLGQFQIRQKMLILSQRRNNEKEEAQRIKAKLLNKPIEETLHITQRDLEGREKETVIKQRVNQTAFRSMILYNYEERCAITGINIPDLLVASHIIPWADSTPKQKLNPENGICLSALYDKAFDRGLITISPDDYTIYLSSALCEYETQSYFDKHFGHIAGQKLIMPIEHRPNRDYLAYHRDRIFKGI